jgi:putative phage-type endonuclease
MIKQGTSEWLEMRKTKIGASDAPIIMNVSPYKTPYQLWQEKLDLVPSGRVTHSMKRGLDLEDLGRQKLIEQTGILFFPEVKLHPEYSWMMASLDGIDPEGKCICEIKWPNKEDHLAALENGSVPSKYFPQLQHQLEVTHDGGVERAYYFSCYQDSKSSEISTALIEVQRNNSYIEQMLKKEQEFLECLHTWLPPELEDGDYEVKNSEEWVSIAEKWKYTNEILKKAKAEEEKYRAELIKMSNGKNCKGSGIKLAKIFRKGLVDYSQIECLNGINLEKYRKESSICYRISQE